MDKKTTKRYNLSLTKADVNQLFTLVEDNKKIVSTELRNRIRDAYYILNNIIVNGGGA